MTLPADDLVVNYFAAPANSFWRWSDNGEVAEWTDGATICYREELSILMQQLQTHIPPLCAVLLVLSACRSEVAAHKDLLLRVVKSMPYFAGEPDDSVMEYFVQVAVTGLDKITALPPELRTKSRRAHLLSEIFGKPGIKTAGESPAVLVGRFGTGVHDQKIFTAQEGTTREAFKAELSVIINALGDFKTAEQLENRLRTGINEVPEPEIPVALPEPETADLMKDLLAEPRTAGMAMLAQKIIAAIHIPMHARPGSDLPYGGISDITNRGNFDRLLLSELAQDDELLMARLVNNEALFLRREEPPYNPHRQRIILIDTTIKMWGMPRVFAMAAALACAFNTKHQDVVYCYGLGKDNYKELSLATKKSVMHAMEQMDHGLDCSAALALFMHNNHGADAEVILITGMYTTTSTVFQRLLAAGSPVNYLVKVDRSGALQFNGIQNGHIKPLNTAKFALEEILFPPVEKKKKQRKTVDQSFAMPLFYQEEDKPLYFPTISARITINNSYFLPEKGVFIVSDTRRLLYWRQKKKGAIELLRYIEPGEYHFGHDGDQTLFVLVKSYGEDTPLRLYRIHTEHTSYRADFTLPLRTNTRFKAAYKEGKFYVQTLRTGPDIAEIDAYTGEVTGYNSQGPQEMNRIKDLGSNIPYLKRFINRGYNVLQRIRTVSVYTQLNELFLDKHYFTVSDKVLKLDSKPSPVQKHVYAHAEKSVHYLPENKHLWMDVRAWPDGSTATIDAAGLLHLKSSNAALPEVTMVLAMNMPIACWASDGFVCGSDYFIANGEEILVTDFYDIYLKPIINHIVAHAPDRTI